MLKYIKKYLRFETMRAFFPIRSDCEILNCYENDRYVIPVIAAFCAIFYVGDQRPGVFLSCLTFVYFTCTFILAIMARNHLKQARKYINFLDLTIFMLPEYYTIKFRCSASFEVFVILLIISVVVWVVNMCIKLPYIMQINAGNDSEEVLKKYWQTFYKVIMPVLLIALFTFAKSRYGGAETVKVPVYILAVHMCFTMFYNLALNRIIFDLIYREEIKAERKQKRTVTYDKGAKRKKPQRKK